MQKPLLHLSHYPSSFVEIGQRVSPNLRFWLLACMGSLIIAASAQIVIPLQPVPITAQTFVVMAFGLAAGWRLAGTTVLLYLAEGLIGMPVFSKFGAGAAHLVGPTGGYLLGFVFAAVWCGWCAERGLDRKPLWLLVALCGAQGIIFALGVLWLGVVVQDMQAAVTMGLLPFIVPELVKAAILSAVFPFIWLSLSRS